MSASDVPNLTRDDAQSRADLLHVESYDVVLDLTDGGGKPVRAHLPVDHHDPVHRRPRRRRRPSSTSSPTGSTASRSTAPTSTCPATAASDGIALPDLAAENDARGRRRPALHQHRRGPAPLRRPARRRGLPLLAVRDRRRQAHVRLLRPARPEGRPSPSASTVPDHWAGRRPTAPRSSERAAARGQDDPLRDHARG